MALIYEYRGQRFLRGYTMHDCTINFPLLLFKFSLYTAYLYLYVPVIVHNNEFWVDVDELGDGDPLQFVLAPVDVR